MIKYIVMIVMYKNSFIRNKKRTRNMRTIFFYKRNSAACDMGITEGNRNGLDITGCLKHTHTPLNAI